MNAITTRACDIVIPKEDGFTHSTLPANTPLVINFFSEGDGHGDYFGIPVYVPVDSLVVI